MCKVMFLSFFLPRPPLLHGRQDRAARGTRKDRDEALYFRYMKIRTVSTCLIELARSRGQVVDALGQESGRGRAQSHWNGHAGDISVPVRVEEGARVRGLRRRERGGPVVRQRKTRERAHLLWNHVRVDSLRFGFLNDSLHRLEEKGKDALVRKTFPRQPAS